MFFACDLARFLVIRAFLVLSNPLYFLGLWLVLKLFSLFENILSTMGIWWDKFFSVARRNALNHTIPHNDEKDDQNQRHAGRRQWHPSQLAGRLERAEDWGGSCPL